MTQSKYIAGAGGGGGGKGGGSSHTPTEADDTLQSVQFASVLDLISEGEIQDQIISATLLLSRATVRRHRLTSLVSSRQLNLRFR